MLHRLASRALSLLVLVCALAGLVGVGGLVVSEGLRAQTITAVNTMVRPVLATASGRAVQVPAYLFDYHTAETTAGTQLKNSIGGLGCVHINKAGAAGSLVTLYDMNSSMTTNATIMIASIDSASALKPMTCFGTLFTEGLYVVISSSGAAPDVTITYR